MRHDTDLPGSPFTKGFGYPDTYRIRIVNEANRRGVARVAKEHRLHNTTVYKWRKAYEFTRKGK